MKKVLEIVGKLERGGLQMVAYNCMKYSKSGEYSFDFLVYGNGHYDFEQDIISAGGHILRLEYKKGNYIQEYIKLKKLLKDNGPYDIVHSHTFFNSGIPMRAAAISGVRKRIAHAHNVERINDKRIGKKFFNSAMRRWMVKYATNFCACSKEAGEYLFGKEPFSKKGLVLNNMVEISKFTFNNESRSQIRKELNIPEGKTVIGNVGRLVEQKNHKHLIEVFRCYHDINPNAILLLVGDGNLRKDIGKQILDLNIADSVILVGTRTDVPNLLSAMDLFVTTSLYEGFGIVLIEAMANGLRCLGPKGVVVDEVASLINCYTVEDTISEWASKIDELVKLGRTSSEESKSSLYNYTPAAFRRLVNELYS